MLPCQNYNIFLGRFCRRNSQIRNLSIPQRMRNSYHLKLEILPFFRVILRLLNKMYQFRVGVRRKQGKVIDIILLLKVNIKAKSIKVVVLRVILMAQL